MTIFDLVEQARVATGGDEWEILAQVRRAWPEHQAFTVTQLALVVRAVRNKPAAPSSAAWRHR